MVAVFIEIVANTDKQGDFTEKPRFLVFFLLERSEEVTVTPGFLSCGETTELSGAAPS